MKTLSGKIMILENNGWSLAIRKALIILMNKIKIIKI